MADIAFGTACNSHGEPAVALSMTISFVTAVATGSRLLAEAREVKQGRRAGFYEVVVSTAAGAPRGARPLRPATASRLGVWLT